MGRDIVSTRSWTQQFLRYDKPTTPAAYRTLTKNASTTQYALKMDDIGFAYAINNQQGAQHAVAIR